MDWKPWYNPVLTELQQLLKIPQHFLAELFGGSSVSSSTKGSSPNLVVWLIGSLFLNLLKKIWHKGASKSFVSITRSKMTY